MNLKEAAQQVLKEWDKWLTGPDDVSETDLALAIEELREAMKQPDVSKSSEQRYE